MTVSYDPSQPIPVRVTRYRCPHCSRSASSKQRCQEHMGRCWQNPEAKGCKTCKHFGTDWEGAESCEVGISLAGRPACETCRGMGWTRDESALPWLADRKCPGCDGDPEPIKGGPIVHCDKWEAES